MNPYNDIALPIAWPDQTARGDEAWMGLLKKIGLVKNLNFKVGHAAIVLIRRRDGLCSYFDFGRYITPRGYGRARSMSFDPRLTIKTKAQFDQYGQLCNLSELLKELEEQKEANHGGGRLFCSVAKDISFDKASGYAEALVEKGPMLYGAFAPDNNSCSRYVAQILVNGMEKQDSRIRKILYPESLKASPMSNVVNAVANDPVYCMSKGKLEQQLMNRWQSARFQLALLGENFSKKASASLPSDQVLGHMTEPLRPAKLPKQAQWLGGLGEGCWFYFRLEEFAGNNKPSICSITRYNHLAKIDYKVYAELLLSEEELHIQPRFSYKVHYAYHEVFIGDKKLLLNSLSELPEQLRQSI